jgi:hypothetical protein
MEPEAVWLRAKYVRLVPAAEGLYPFGDAISPDMSASVHKSNPPGRKTG